MAQYKPRIVDEAIVHRLRNKGAILVEGAKWCGKTTTCEQHAASILYMSDPDRVKQNLQLADISPRSLSTLAQLLTGSKYPVAGPRYFKYKGEWLNDIRRRMEA